jgi:hypothetical protein
METITPDPDARHVRCISMEVSLKLLVAVEMKVNAWRTNLGDRGEVPP